jgi:hypothetical protein
MGNPMFSQAIDFQLIKNKLAVPRARSSHYHASAGAQT